MNIDFIFREPQQVHQSLIRPASGMILEAITTLVGSLMNDLFQ